MGIFRFSTDVLQYLAIVSDHSLLKEANFNHLDACPSFHLDACPSFHGLLWEASFQHYGQWSKTNALFTLFVAHCKGQVYFS